MGRALPEAGVAYLPGPELGGRRAPKSDSANLAWRNASFRGYADYMGTQPCRDATARWAQLARAQRTAVMCAEALWWQCHRSLISDDFKARGWEAIHLVAPGRDKTHSYTAAARLVAGKLDYTVVGSPQAALF